MPWKINPDGTTTLIDYYSYRNPKNPSRWIGSRRQKTITTPRREKDIPLAFAKWQAELGQSSLTVTKFSDLITHFLQQYPDGYNGTFSAALADLKERLGYAVVDEIHFPASLDRYMSMLAREEYSGHGWDTERRRSIATLNKRRAAVRRVLTYAWQTGRIETVPVRQWGIRKVDGRRRVLDDKEQLTLLNTLQEKGSWLYWPVYFSLRNPIRADDLFRLERSALDLSVPWIRLWPSKTRGRQQSPTCLPEIDDTLRHYFVNILPAECPLLFPQLTGCGGWRPAPGYKRHWETMLRNAGIANFHWHDLRHCATKHMLDTGYTSDNLRRLQIHGTLEMIRLYDNADQLAVVNQLRSRYVGDEGQREAGNA